jgi:hypothetical protein
MEMFSFDFRGFARAVSIGAAIAMAALPASAAAQQELGRAVFKGKEIILLDDSTWSYARGGSADEADGKTCFSSAVITGLSMCHDTAVKATKMDGDFEYAVSTRRGDFYGGIIAEGLPIDTDVLGKVIVQNAGAAAGGEDHVAVRSHQDVTVAGQPFRVIEYFVEIEKMPIIYRNYYAKIDDRGSLQIVFFTVGTDIAKFASVEKSILDGITIK